MMADQKEKHIEMSEYIAPCGIYCKACESYEKTCTGCRSEKTQKHKANTLARLVAVPLRKY